MTTSTNWQALYRSYDDASLEVLANAGLLRRAHKDVEAGKVAWLSQQPDHGVISSDGQQVTLTQKGAQAAQCDCPATSCCKHILAAILWLRVQADDVATDDTTPDDVLTNSSTAESTTQAEQVDVISEILALTPEALFKSAGKAATRMAWQWFKSANVDAADQRVQIGIETQRVTIHLGSLDTTVIYLAHGGYNGMLSEVKASERKAVHLLALAEVFRQHEQPWHWPEADAATASPALDQLSADELDLLGNIDLIANELLAQGLSHVSRSSATTLRMLNLSARAEGLPLLAGHLRTLSGLVNQLAARSDLVSERQALMQMAKIHALCTALRVATGDGLATLRGRVRRRYQLNSEQTSMYLLPLGGHWWTTLGGARGLTLSFWEREQQAVVDVTLARPDGNDVSFQPHSVWSYQALWKKTPEQLCRTALTLHHPKLSDDGKLSSGADSYVSTEPMPSPQEEDVRQMGIHDWGMIQQALSDQASLSSQLPPRLLLRPVRMDEPLLDEVRQTLLWPVYDASGEQLLLDIPYSAERQHKIAQIELCHREKIDVRAVLVVIQMEGGRIRLEPLSLLWVNAQAELATFSLDFDAFKASKVGWVSPMLARITRLLTLKQNNAALAQFEQPSLSQRLCDPVLDVLESLACTGRRQLSDYQREALLIQTDLVQAAGIELLAQRLKALTEAHEIMPNHLLAACHIIDRLLILDM